MSVNIIRSYYLQLHTHQSPLSNAGALYRVCMQYCSYVINYSRFNALYSRPYLAIGQGGQLPPQRNWLQSIINYYLFIAGSY